MSTNVVKISNKPEAEKIIAFMRVGDCGFTVPWAYKDGRLNVDYTIDECKGGTATLFVRCVANGQYEIDYEFDQTEQAAEL